MTDNDNSNEDCIPESTLLGNYLRPDTRFTEEDRLDDAFAAAAPEPEQHADAAVRAEAEEAADPEPEVDQALLADLRSRTQAGRNGLLDKWVRKGRITAEAADDLEAALKASS